MELFLAKYTVKGIEKTVAFKKSEFDQPRAEAWLKANDIKNFMFLFEPLEPEQIDEQTTLFKGEVGFDITAENVMQYVNEGKNIVIDSGGGSHFDGLKIHDRIKLSGKNPTIGVIGICASAAFDILMAGGVRWASKNSRGLIHNPWIVACGDDEELRSIANMLTMEKNAAAEMYADISGKDKTAILNLMKEERFMTAEEMLQWNFITEIRTTKTEPSTNNQTEQEMAENKELTEKVNKMESIINGLKNLFSSNPAVKNIVVTDATGIQIDFYELEEESQIAVDAKARVDGADAEGEFVISTGMHEGKTFVFAGGILTEIKEPATPEVDEEAAALAAENEALKAEVKNLKADITKHKSEVSKLAVQVTEFRAMVTDGNPETNTPPLKKDTKGKFSYKKP